MLKINRLRVEINTINGTYGIDETFQEGLNFVSSLENTCGKSSILAAIYYCLGFEQIIGGVSGIGSKVLTSAFKSVIEDSGKSWRVTESGVYLEINNGNETRTIYRNIKSESKDNHLITVYYCDYNSIGYPKTLSEDYYVNMQNSATSEKGFHTFLEEFLHMNLPTVPTSDNNERKLYLQVVFASMFIEQKHGWADIFSGMPIFGIREAKKRIVEYILGLDTLKNEKMRNELRVSKSRIESKWEQLILDIERLTYTESCEVFNLPRKPKVLSKTDYSKIIVRTPNSLTIKSEIELLENEYTKLKELKPRVLDNFEELNTELSKVQSEIIEFEKYLENIRKKEVNYSEIIKRLNADLELLILDIRNNNDAARLKKLGSDDRGINTLVGICPVCNQPINDSLIDANAINEFMSIEDNIRHLKEQKKMIEFTIESRKESRNRLRREKEDIERRLQGLRRLAHTLRSDIYMSTNTDDSEAIMLKRIEITKRIERLSQLENDFDELIDKLKDLSVEWNIYIEQKSKLPSKGISDSDTEKIALLKKYFIANLKQYNYSSLSSVEGIDISIDSSLLPTIDGFDMKFDSSASDGIRVIWAFTIALLQTSIEKNGNHPGVIIFDEPAQQSIVSEDMKSFIESAVKIKKPFQIITAITLNSQELIEIIDELDNSSYHKIAINGKAFRKFN